MIKAFIKKALPYLVKVKRSQEEITLMFNMELERTYKERAQLHANPLVKYGEMGFSQSDEDGLVKEMVKRLKINAGTFVEFGVGTGIENNTLVLLALGWQGVWLGGENLDYEVDFSPRLTFKNSWITKDNIVSLYREGLEEQGIEYADVISLDLDGNDLVFCEKLLEDGVNPSLFIIEYNARFSPPIRFSMDYDAANQWLLDDYYGASLQSFVDLFSRFGYSLICCNAATGVNGFFVKDEELKMFPEVPDDIADIFSPPFFIMHSGFTMPRSMRTFRHIIR